MRSTSRGQLHSRSAFARPAAPIRARPSAPAALDLAAAPRRRLSGLPRSTSSPVVLVDDRPHAGIVGRDHRQPGGHRLDQDDPERLRRLGREQEEVGGAEHVGQLAVGDGAEEVDAVADAGLAGARRGSPRAARRRRRRRGGRRGRRAAARPSIATSSALEVVGEVEGRDEGGDERVGGDAEPVAKPGVVGARGEELRVDAVRHLDELLRVALAGSAQVGDRVGVVGGEHADAVGGADQRRRDGVLVGLEHRAADAAADEPVLVVDEQRLRGAGAGAAGRAASARSRR